MDWKEFFKRLLIRMGVESAKAAAGVVKDELENVTLSSGKSTEVQ